MDLVLWTLTMGLGLVVGLSVLLVSGVIYTVFTDCVLPADIQEPGKLRLIYGAQIAIGTLGNIIHNLTFGTQISAVRFLQRKVLMATTQKEEAGLVTQDVHFDGVPVRVYQPPLADSGKSRGILYFHGGGWVFGSINEYDHLCRYIARETGSVVVSVEYRLAPEHRYPTQFEDCLRATLHFMRNAVDYGVDDTRIVVSGDSAGGNLTAAVCLRVTDMEETAGLPPLRAQVMIYPALQMVDFSLPSYQQNQWVPLLFRTRTVFFFLQYLNGDLSVAEEVLKGQHLPVQLKTKYRSWINADLIPEDFKARGYSPSPLLAHEEDVFNLIQPSLEPSFSPLLASDATVEKLPPAYILTCEFDVLRDDGLLFKKRLEDNGVPVTWYHVPDGFHGIVSFFDNGYLTFPSGKRAVDNIIAFLKDT